MNLSNTVLGDRIQQLSRRVSMHQSRVQQMMVKIRELSKKTPLRTTVGLPPPEHVLKQAKLVFEECMELMEAIGVGVKLRADHTPITRDSIVLTMDKPPEEQDIVHIAKEIADVSVVNTGMFVEFGIADMSVIEEVDVANLRKFGEGCYVDENGKLRKPPNFKDADVNSVLRAQGWHPDIP